MLARAVYEGGSILLLDEPTAALDAIAEDQIYQKYNQIAQNNTSIFISHRFASTRFSKRIIPMENSGIAEIGTHEQLMNLNGRYATMYNTQS